ncbi:hypothetical protein EJF36_06985 [Bacillus sp. HMF5848]|uniref:hypothetical protein n=1 Tax=Bacillus sp. HMF5848 TaxID=2495421 RepID=UPI000F7738CA|nr:hypothetical protein [Bacillus sp. HMF5848]RSK26623.1 hypothetical protein EJF36_06985 [Bacillus sp. HMF5848]
MQFFDEETIRILEKLEQNCNKQLYNATDTLNFVECLNESLNIHVQQVQSARQYVTECLTLHDVPCKHSIIDLSKYVIKFEDRLDMLEDFVYTVIKNQRKVQIKVSRVKEGLKSAKSDLYSIDTNNRSTKLLTISQQLSELKAMF